MAKIVTLIDHLTEETSYPQTTPEAVLIGEGKNIGSVIKAFTDSPGINVAIKEMYIPDFDPEDGIVLEAFTRVEDEAKVRYGAEIRVGLTTVGIIRYDKYFNLPVNRIINPSDICVFSYTIGTSIKKGYIIINTDQWVENDEVSAEVQAYVLDKNLSPVCSNVATVSCMKYALADVLKELYLEGTTTDEEYFVSTVYVDYAGVLKINISDSNGIVAQINNSTAIKSGVVPVTEANDSGISGYAAITDVLSSATESGFYPICDKIDLSEVSNLELCPIIKASMGNVSANPALIDFFDELYLVNTDGTKISDEYIYYLGNLYESGSRRVINIKRANKSDLTDNAYICQIDSSQPTVWGQNVLELKERDNSGVKGYAVVNWDKWVSGIDIFDFNYNVISVLDYAPFVKQYLRPQVDDTDDFLRVNSEILSKVKEFVGSTVDAEIAAAKKGSYTDANGAGFLAANTGSQNSSVMNTLLASGGTIIVEAPGTYYINGRMTIKSNTTLLFAKGVVLKMQAQTGVFVNAAAINGAINGYDQNIRIIGLHLDSSGFQLYSGVESLRGCISLEHVKNAYVSDFTCRYYKAHGFCIHICDWENLEICNAHIVGDKDAIHLGRGKNGYIHNCAICSVDDTIALNAWDYYESNPEIGDIQNVRIEKIVELPHRFNTASEYSHTLGFCTRFLNGAWTDWTSGMYVQHGTTVIYQDKLYRVKNLFSNTPLPDLRASTVAPNVSPMINGVQDGQAGADGVFWHQETSPAAYASSVSDVTIDNYITYQDKFEGSFCMNAINEINHKSWTEGATLVPNDNIKITGLQSLGATPAIMLIQTETGAFEISDSVIDMTKVYNSMLHFRARYDMEYGTPVATLKNDNFKIAENMNLSSAANDYMDAIDVKIGGAGYNKTPGEVVKTENTTVETITVYDV